MRKYIPVISFSLLLSLFIYLFFRTEKTVVNQVFISVFSRESYLAIKHYINNILSLHPLLIYSLPEGLWVFCITITSRFFVLSINRRKRSLVLVPVFLVFGWEICQLFTITNGRFDFADIGVSLLFWWLAYTFTKPREYELVVHRQINIDGLSCGFCYSIVYLSHVI